MIRIILFLLSLGSLVFPCAEILKYGAHEDETGEIEFMRQMTPAKAAFFQACLVSALVFFVAAIAGVP